MEYKVISEFVDKSGPVEVRVSPGCGPYKIEDGEMAKRLEGAGCVVPLPASEQTSEEEETPAPTRGRRKKKGNQ